MAVLLNTDGSLEVQYLEPWITWSNWNLDHLKCLDHLRALAQFTLVWFVLQVNRSIHWYFLLFLI